MQGTDWNGLWEKYERWSLRLLKLCGGAGTLLALIYFLRIRNMPIDSPQSIVGLALAICLVSAALFAAISIYWGMPALFFRYCIETCDTVVSAWMLGAKGASVAPNSGDRSVASSKIAIWCAATIVMPWLILFSYSEPDLFGGRSMAYWTRVPALLFSVFVLCSYCAWPRKASDFLLPSGKRIPARQARALRVLVFLIFTFATIFPLWIFLNVMIDSDLAQENERWHIIAIFIAAAVFASLATGLAIALAVRRRAEGAQKWLVQPGLIAASVVIGISWLGAWGGLLDRVMDLVSVRVSNATLVLNKNGCQPFETTSLKRLAPSSAPSAVSAGCVVENVTVLSRVGARWPVVCRSDPAKSPRHLIKAEDVTDVLTGPRASLTLIDPSAEVNLCVNAARSK